MLARACLYLTILVSWAGLPAMGTVLFYDSFSYPDGSLTGVSGGTWTHLGGGTGEATVNSGSVQLDQAHTEDVLALLNGQPYPANGTTNDLYASFRVRFTALPATGGAYFAHFKDSSSVYRARVWALTNGASSDCFRFGLSSTNPSSASVTNSASFGLNTNILIVTRLTCSNSAATLWTNPQSESDPAISTPAANSGITVVSYSLREATGMGGLELDDLIIGTSFAEVLVPPRQPLITANPQSQTVAEGSSVMFSAGAVGAGPLSLQWLHDGVPVADATNSSLSLGLVTTNQAGIYSLAASNALGTAVSEGATLTVIQAPRAPSIVSGPRDQTVAPGEDANFAVTSAGTTPLNYQWRFYGTNLAGATGPQLLLAAVTPAQGGPYRVVVTNIAGAVTSAPANLSVIVVPGTGLTNFSLLTYNVKGNGATNWTTNSLQVRAIGRQVQHLRPDIITFQEIPNEYTYEMTNFVKAFLPGYWLATNSATDGYIRSAIASRFPLVRSQSWLAHADLDPFGYTNANFTRDLFEAQVSVPSLEKPLHVFTTHLKSGSTSTDLQRRAAEAAAISNFFVTTFQTNFGSDPYLLTGDLNESDTKQTSIQALISAPTGLRLTSPINPATQSYFTYSSTSTTKRFDYIMPSGILFTSILTAEVFRTDVLTNPAPTDVLTDDSQTASDHLPVLTYFRNPYDTPFQVTSCGFENPRLSLAWSTGPNRLYSVEASSNLVNWSVLATNLSSGDSPVFTFSTNLAEPVKFFRVYRAP